jgi:hypothetical protein
LKKKTKPAKAKRKRKVSAKAPRRGAKPQAVLLAKERIGTELKVTASHDGEVIYVDTINPDCATQRERFLRGVVKHVPGVDPTELERDLLEPPAPLQAISSGEASPAPGSDQAAADGDASGVPPPPVKVVLRYLSDPGGRAGTLTAERDGATVHLDKMDSTIAARRQRFIKELEKNLPGLDAADTKAQLLSIAQQEMARRPAPAAPAPARGEHLEGDALLQQMPQEVRDEARALLQDPNLIQKVVDDVALLNVAGEKVLTATLYLIGVSRLLSRPLAGIVQGPSTSGKSYLIEKTASLFPPETVIFATQMTPQALFHMKPGTLRHRFIVGGERSRVEDDERAEATRALREMLSSGKLSKLMPMRVEGGRIETVLIEQDGPIAHVESTTLTKIFDEDANRCVLLHTDERPEQTRRIIRQAAATYGGAADPAVTDRIIQRHHALQRMLRSLPVVIPYAERLGELFVSDRVEVRRAFPHLMSMIQALALLHQQQRQQDTDGRLIATAADYELARHLLVKPMERLLGGGLSDPAQRFFDRLRTWAHDTFSSTEAKKKERNCKSSVHAWLHELHEAGIVELVEEARGRAPTRWRLSGNTPDDASGGGLPEVHAVFPDSTWQHGHNAEPATVP